MLNISFAKRFFRGTSITASARPRKHWHARSLTFSLGLLILAGCGGPKVDIGPVGDASAAREVLEDLLLDGPVRAQIFGDPYGLDPARQEQLVTAGFGDGIQGVNARFSADPGLYSAAEPRLVVILNPKSEPPTAEACRAPERIRTGPATEELILLAAFCEGDQLVNSARAQSDIAGPTDQRLKRMFWQTAGVMFPDNYRNEYGVDIIPGLNIGFGGSFGF